MSRTTTYYPLDKFASSLFVLAIFSYCFVNSSLFYAQGLNYEIGFNYEYDTTPVIVVSDGSDTFMAYREVEFEASIRLCKIDSTGTILWQKYFNAHGLNPIDKMIPDGQGGVYVAGDTNGICDVEGPNQGYIVRYDALGNILWSDVYGDAWPNPTYVTGLHLTDNGFVRLLRMDHWGDPTGSLMTYFNNGLFLFETEIDNAFVSGFIEVGSYAHVSYKGSNITGYDVLGNIVNAFDLPSEIVDIVVFNDVIYVVLSDEIVVLNNNLVPVLTNTFDGYDNFSRIKNINGTLQFLSSSATQKHIITTNILLEVVDVDSYDIPGISGVDIDFSDSHLSVLENYELSDYNAVRMRSFHRENPINTVVNNTDIGVANIEINSLEELNFDNLSVQATVTIKNYGANNLTEFHLLHMLWYDICGPHFFNQPFQDVNLAPGESMTVDIELYGEIPYEVSMDSTFVVDLCMYSANPNSLVDIDVSNDAFCQSVNYKYCPTDFDRDGRTDGADFAIILGVFGVECIPSHTCPTDIDGNGITDGNDFSLFLGSFGVICD